ncbi:hypothetical protein ACXPWS_18585 [Mycobacterium sp. BMJ-28]
MTTPGRLHILAEQGGLVIAENGPVLLVIDRGGGSTRTVAFVLAILTLVCGGFGLVSLFAADIPVAVAAVLLLVGLVCGVGAVYAGRSVRRRRLSPLSAFTPVAILDRQGRVYRDGAGQPVAPLDHVRFERRMQATSSSAMLVAVTPVGTRILKRGNPFGGDIGNLDRVLTAAVSGP